MQQRFSVTLQAALTMIVPLLSGCGAPVAVAPSATQPPATPVAATALAPENTLVPVTPAPTEPVATLLATSTRAPESAAVVIKAYDLGPATIAQAQVGGDRHRLPYRIQGVIGVPAGTGPHPLVVITHGSHPGCPNNPSAVDLEIDTWPCSADSEQRNDLGWRYLIEALAKQGYVAVSFNMNAVNTAAWGGSGSTYERYASIVDAQLAKLGAANQGTEHGFGLDLTGRIDVKRTALVGHSQGGGYAMIYAEKRTESAYTALGGPLVALLLVAPATQSAQPDAPSAAQDAPPDLPIGVVMGACDGDVSDLQGFLSYEQARGEAQRTQTVQVVVPYGANHNFFNAALGPDGLDPDGAPGCDRPAGRLKPAQQQAFLVTYAHDFFAEVFDKAAPPAAWQAGSPAPQQLYGVPVLTALLEPTAKRQALVQLRGTTLPTDTAGVAVSANAPLQAAVCSAQNDQCDPANYAIPAVQNLSQPVIRLFWKERGGALNLTLPASQRDLSAFAAIQLRVALDGFAQANTDGQAFTVRVRDASGTEAAVTLPADTYALQPPTTLLRDADTQPYLRGNAPLAAVRVPLAAFHGVDLAHIESIALVFDQRDQGALFVTDLELVRS